MLNQAPYEWSIEQLMTEIKDPINQVHTPNGWQLARPMGFFCIKSRLRLVWIVFTGRADALTWPFQNPRGY